MKINYDMYGIWIEVGNEIDEDGDIIECVFDDRCSGKLDLIDMGYSGSYDNEIEEVMWEINRRIEWGYIIGIGDVMKVENVWDLEGGNGFENWDEYKKNVIDNYLKDDYRNYC